MKPMDLLIPPIWRAIRVRPRGTSVISTMAALFLLAVAALIRADAPAGHAGAKLVIAPQSIAFRGPGEQHGLLVTLVEADGRMIDVTAKCRFGSSDAGKIAVSSDGQCRTVADGNSDITADYEGLTARIGVVASDTSKSTPPSFKQDVVPLLTRAGCNAGSCH